MMFEKVQQIGRELSQKWSSVQMSQIRTFDKKFTNQQRGTKGVIFAWLYNICFIEITVKFRYLWITWFYHIFNIFTRFYVRFCTFILKAIFR